MLPVLLFFCVQLIILQRMLKIEFFSNSNQATTQPDEMQKTLLCHVSAVLFAVLN